MRRSGILMIAMIAALIATAIFVIAAGSRAECDPVDATFTDDFGGTLHLMPDSTYRLSQPAWGDLPGGYIIIETEAGRTVCLDLPMCGEVVAFRMSGEELEDDEGNRWRRSVSADGVAEARSER